MDLQTFARLHGVLIPTVIEDGRWHRVPTTAHPKRKDGAYLSRGVYGFVQDHSEHDEPIEWRPDDNEVKAVDRQRIERQVQEAQAKIRADQRAAAERAGWILKQCAIATHPYLNAKGFPDENGNVWNDKDADDRKLCIPMRVDGRVVGLQTISSLPAHQRTDSNGKVFDVPAFEKRFLYGQQVMGTAYVIDNKGPRVYCEGYATGLSVRAALIAMKVRYTLHVCFTAGNLANIAGNFKSGMVIADNDNPSKQSPAPGGRGKAVAEASGLPYWISDREKEDANDYHQRRGLFALSNSMRPIYTRAMK